MTGCVCVLVMDSFLQTTCTEGRMFGMGERVCMYVGVSVFVGVALCMGTP